MTITKAILLIGVLTFGLITWAQEFPRAEIGADYSYARYAPSASHTQGLSLNGGGGTAVYNFNQYLGIKMDLQGYGSNSITWNIPPGPNFPQGGIFKAQGNLFTYLFGPQVKFRTPKFQPFAHLLFGGAHSNVYGNAFSTICQPIASAKCSFRGAPSGNGFAMAFGGGVDIPIGKAVSFRPAEVDYLLTNFENQFNNSNQNNFRYSAGINFNIGSSK